MIAWRRRAVVALLVGALAGCASSATPAGSGAGDTPTEALEPADVPAADLAAGDPGGQDPVAADAARDGDEPRPPPGGGEHRPPGPFDADADADADSQPPDAEVAAPVRVALIADLNSSYGSASYHSAVHAAVERLIVLEPDLVIAAGDLVAGQQSGLDYLAMWAGFHAAVTDPLAAAGVPLAVTPGNHDASGYAAYQQERQIFVDQWLERPPDVDSFVDSTEYPLRYTFSVGPVFFASLDATTVGALGAAQMAWLDAQLGGSAATAAVARVVVGHLPLYPVAAGSSSDEVIGDPAFEALLNEHGVDIYVSGHQHAFYPGRRGALRLTALACLGTGPNPLLGEETTSPRSIAWLEVDGDGNVTLDALTGTAFDEVVLRTSLPPQVGEGAQALVRDDLY